MIDADRLNRMIAAKKKQKGLITCADANEVFLEVIAVATADYAKSLIEHGMPRDRAKELVNDYRSQLGAWRMKHIAELERWLREPARTVDAHSAAPGGVGKNMR